MGMTTRQLEATRRKRARAICRALDAELNGDPDRFLLIESTRDADQFDASYTDADGLAARARSLIYDDEWGIRRVHDLDARTWEEPVEVTFDVTVRVANQTGTTEGS